MPLVVVRYNHHYSTADKEWFLAGSIKPLKKRLPEIVAEALHVPENIDAHLKASGVEVRFEPTNEFDEETIPFAITIFANDYPERRQNLEERKEKIVRALSDVLDDCWQTYSVWVLLAPGAYGMLYASNDWGERIASIVAPIMGVELKPGEGIDPRDKLTGDLSAIAMAVRSETGNEIVINEGDTFGHLMSQTYPDWLS